MRKDHFADFKNLYDMCYAINGGYVAVIGFCDENNSSTNLLVHIIFMMLAINFLYLGFALNKHESKVNLRRCLHLIAAIFGGAAIISGWTAKEITSENLSYVGLYTTFVFAAAVHVIYVDLFECVMVFCLKKMKLYESIVKNKVKICLSGTWNIARILLLFAMAPYMMLVIIIRYLHVCYKDRVMRMKGLVGAE